MFKYDFAYKYLAINNITDDLIIELSIDNMLGKVIYSAKTNYLFQDSNGDWGHACGVGDCESKALTMCFNEINSYISLSNTDTRIVDLPQKITLIYKEKPIILYIANRNTIVTNNGNHMIEPDTDIIAYFSKHYMEYENSGIDKATKSKLLNNNYNFFDNLSKKFMPSNNIQSIK